MARKGDKLNCITYKLLFINYFKIDEYNMK